MKGKRRPCLLERIEQLRAESGWKVALADPVGVRQCIFRHVERAEQEVEEWKRRGKILLPSPFRHGVMPAVKNRTDDDVFERTERPVEIRVHESGVRDGERT